MSITIRQARPDDASAIYNMIYELAVYEKAPQEVVTTPDEIRETLFGDDSKTEALICEIDGKTAGYAVFFTSYSTWLGRNGIYMEDLYISPDYRGQGAGRALLKPLPGMRLRAAADALSGACWTGTSRPLIFTSVLAPRRKANGSAIASMAKRWLILRSNNIGYSITQLALCKKHSSPERAELLKGKLVRCFSLR